MKQLLLLLPLWVLVGCSSAPYQERLEQCMAKTSIKLAKDGFAAFQSEKGRPMNREESLNAAKAWTNLAFVECKAEVNP